MCPYSRGGTLKEGTVNIYSGLINTLELAPESIAPNIGRTNLITANNYDGSINVIFIGSEHPHNNILGISSIKVEILGKSSLQFLDMQKSTLSLGKNPSSNLQ